MACARASATCAIESSCMAAPLGIVAGIVRPLLCRGRVAVMGDGNFSPLAAGNRPLGPGSNTGQKSTLTAPIVDWCTVVLDGDTFRTWARKRKPADVLRAIFNTGTRIAVGALRD